MNKDFDKKLGQMGKNDLQGEQERSRLIYKGLSHHEYHYYFDKLYNQYKNCKD